MVPRMGKGMGMQRNVEAESRRMSTGAEIPTASGTQWGLALDDHGYWRFKGSLNRQGTAQNATTQDRTRSG
jgi:hypothetical protein